MSSSVWKTGSLTQQNEKTDVFERWRVKEEGQRWMEFWNGWVYFDDGEAYLRYEWMHNFMSTIIEEHKKRGYIFAFSLQTMKRRMMYWLFELDDAAQTGRAPLVPAVHAGHRNLIDDFTEYDHAFDFSKFWIGFVAKWVTCDMLYNYDDKLAALLPAFLYAHLDTMKSSAIIDADNLKEAIDRAIAEEEEELGIRRPDDRRRDDMYYQDTGYYKGNRDYS